MPIITTGAVIVGVAEVAKLSNTLLQAYFEAARLAKMTEAEIDLNFTSAKKEYFALPLPGDISEPK